MGENAVFAGRVNTRRIVANWWHELREATCKEVNQDAIISMFSTATDAELQKVCSLKPKDVTELFLEDVVPTAFHASWDNNDYTLSNVKMEQYLLGLGESVQKESEYFMAGVNAMRGFYKVPLVNEYFQAFANGTRPNFKIAERKRLFGYLIVWLLLKEVMVANRMSARDVKEAVRRSNRVKI